jgi:hypothetical protein
VLGDAKMGASMGKLARERVEDSFTWRAVARRTKAAYDEVEPA